MPHCRNRDASKSIGVAAVACVTRRRCSSASYIKLRIYDWLEVDINYTADAFVRDQGIVLLRAGRLLSSQFYPAGYFLFADR